MSKLKKSKEVAISVNGVSKYFAPSKGQRTLKQGFTSFFSRNKKDARKESYWALKDIKFEVKKGEFFGIVGRNGSGKSTLLKMIAGIYTPTKGEIQVDGKIVPFIELGVGFNAELSGRDNVFLNGALLGFDRSEMAEMYDEIVEFAELEEHMDVKLKNFSSGMQVRLAFSIAIRAKSEILLIDEVLAVGDASFQQKCFDYFEELKKRKQTVVFVSHDMASVQRFCTTAVYIKNGEITYIGKPSKVADDYIEANIEDKTTKPIEGEGPKLSEAHKITSKILSQQKDSLVLEFTYKSEDKNPMYVAISILKDGMSVAEITTPIDMKLTNSGKVSYTLNTGILNGGIYQITSILCTLKNRKLLCIGNRNKFVVKGNDIIRGSVIKLEDSWRIV